MKMKKVLFSLALPALALPLCLTGCGSDSSDNGSTMVGIGFQFANSDATQYCTDGVVDVGSTRLKLSLDPNASDPGYKHTTWASATAGAQQVTSPTFNNPACHIQTLPKTVTIKANQVNFIGGTAKSSSPSSACDGKPTTSDGYCPATIYQITYQSSSAASKNTSTVSALKSSVHNQLTGDVISLNR